MLRILYNWTMRQAERPQALWVLALVAFAESSVFPIPPDALMIPMILATPSRAWRIALTCVVASVLGGGLGYAIGALMYDTIARSILDFYNATEAFERFCALYRTWGAWIVFVAGVTPFPYKVVTIASGATALDPVVFTVSSVVARSVRFFLVAALLRRFGPSIRSFIERRLGLLLAVACALALGMLALWQWTSL